MERTPEKPEQHKSMFSLDRRVVLITGGASGLGKLFGETLADFGADIAIADIDEATARQTAGLIEGRGRRALSVKADVSQPDQVQRMVDETLSRFGTIDILAGTGPGNSTTVLIYNLYRDLQFNHNTGMAATQSVLLFVLVAGLTFLQFRTTERRVTYNA